VILYIYGRSLWRPNERDTDTIREQHKKKVEKGPDKSHQDNYRDATHKLRLKNNMEKIEEKALEP